MIVYTLLAGAARNLDLLKRVPQLLRSRGWPHRDVDLCSVLSAAIALKYIGAGRTPIKRPRAADECGGKWPRDAGKLTASQIVAVMELERLLEL